MHLTTSVYVLVNIRIHIHTEHTWQKLWAGGDFIFLPFPWNISCGEYLHELSLTSWSALPELLLLQGVENCDGHGVVLVSMLWSLVWPSEIFFSRGSSRFACCLVIWTSIQSRYKGQTANYRPQDWRDSYKLTALETRRVGRNWAELEAIDRWKETRWEGLHQKKPCAPNHTPHYLGGAVLAIFNLWPPVWAFNLVHALYVRGS